MEIGKGPFFLNGLRAVRLLEFFYIVLLFAFCFKGAQDTINLHFVQITRKENMDSNILEIHTTFCLFAHDKYLGYFCTS